MSEIIDSKEKLRDWLEYESKYYIEHNRIVFTLRSIACFEKNVIWHFQKRLRITEYYKNCGHKVRYALSKMLLNKLSNKTGLRIEENVCGRGLHIMHLGPVLTNKNVRIGENCSIHINTHFVARGTTEESPTLGDNIVVGVGTTILGGVYIANNIAVGANSLVNKSFEEEGIAIAGCPARKISNNGRIRWNQNKKSISEEL